MDRLARHLDEEAEVLEAARGILEQIGRALITRDLDSLRGCVAEEPRITARSGDLADRRKALRQELAAVLHVLPDQATATRAVQALGDGPARQKVEQARDRVAAAAREIRSLGYANAVVANHACAFYAELLGSLTGNEGPATYGRTGAAAGAPAGPVAVNANA
jgi:hypothetical protein